MPNDDMVIRWSEEAMEYKDRCDRAGFALSAVMSYTEDTEVPVDHNLLNASLSRVLSILQGNN